MARSGWMKIHSARLIIPIIFHRKTSFSLRLAGKVVSPLIGVDSTWDIAIFPGHWEPPTRAGMHSLSSLLHLIHLRRTIFVSRIGSFLGLNMNMVPIYPYCVQNSKPLRCPNMYTPSTGIVQANMQKDERT